MPQITRLGVARQATELAQRAINAAEDSTKLIGEEQEAYIEDAKVWTRQIAVYAEFADRKGWAAVARHASTQYTLAAAACEKAGITPYN